MRITLDANVLVRANNLAKGPAREILQILRSEVTHRLVRQYVADLEEVCTLVYPVVVAPVVLTDPDDDPVLYTALDRNAEVLCTLNEDFYKPNVVAFCGKNRIQLMHDVELLHALRQAGTPAF